MAGTAADAVLAIGAVDVNVSVPSIGVAGFDAVKAEDAGEHEVFIRGHAGLPMAYGFTSFEDGAGLGFIANFFADDKAADGGFETAFLKADAKLGGADWPCSHLMVTVPKRQPLGADGNFDSRAL